MGGSLLCMRGLARRRQRGRRTVALLLAFLSMLCASALADPAVGTATGDASTPTDAGNDTRSVDASAAERDIEDFTAKTQLIISFVAGNLAPETSLRALFDIDIEDSNAVALEVVRLRAWIHEFDRLEADTRRRGGSLRKGSETDAALVSPSLVQARLELDRARLAFYARTREERHSLVVAFEERRAAHLAAKAETEAQRRAREAEEARLRALEAARNADTETERLVSEEHARLLGIAGQQRAFASSIEQLRAEMIQRREGTLKWQRRTRDLRGAGSARGSDDVDITYDELRSTLRVNRAALDAALDAPPSAIPRAGDSPLRELRLETDALREQRRVIEAEADRLAAARTAVDEESLALLMEETTALNRERLLLLPYLSKEKRSAVTGFSAAGRNQAAAEAFQLSLILRYHKRTVVQALRNPGALTRAVGAVVARSALVLFEWFAAAVIFLWWRRRAKDVLEGILARMRESDRLAKLPAPSLGTSCVAFLTHIRSPLEWLALVVVMRAALPTQIQTLLEVEVIFVICTWTFASSAIVESVDALAASGPFARFGATSSESNGLRHRSLRLVGRVIAAYGVTLALCARLVGQGTIYELVASTWGFTLLPVLFVLVYWWRPSVFARVSLVRKPSRLERWLLEHQRGWLSFVAAAVGGGYLFVFGAVRSARAWVGRFEVTRRTTAYLFRRRLDRIGEEQDLLTLDPLPEEASLALSPTYSLKQEGAGYVSSVNESRVSALMSRIRGRKGGLVAIVGERGMGKSSILHRIQSQQGGTLLAETPIEGLDALRAILSKSLGSPSHFSLEALASKLADEDTAAVMLDDFQRFAQPVMGGMRTFDSVMHVAGRHAARTTWVFVFDSVMWRFLERARSARPAFDDIVYLESWREEEISELLRERTKNAGIQPDFEMLLDRLPPSADEVDKAEAQVARAERYHRLLWDHSAGNPGVALHMWQKSLGVDARGRVLVRALQSLDLHDLEQLPDSAVFVLRAVLQLAPVKPDAIVKATLLRPLEVLDALRYAQARGYVEHADGRYRVTWTWFRPATLFLQRRHLLVAS